MEVFNHRKSVIRKSKSILFAKINEKNIYENQKDKIHPRLSSLIRKRYTDTLKEVLEFKKKENESIFKSELFSRILKSGFMMKISNSLFQAFISIFASILYIVSTYFPDSQSSTDTILTAQNNIKLLEAMITILIIISLIVGFYTTKKKARYFFKFGFLLDIVTILPVLLQFFSNINSIGFIRILRLVRVIRTVRIIKIVSFKKRGLENSDDLGREIFKSCIIIATYIFLSAGIVHYLNNEFTSIFGFVDTSNYKLSCTNSSSFFKKELNFTKNSLNISLECGNSTAINTAPQTLSFDSAFYFVIITVSTLGYGDITPTNVLGKVLVGFLIISIVIILTKQVGEINEIIIGRDLYKIPFKSEGSKHVIIGGFFSRNSLVKFLEEFYNIDHKNKIKKNKKQSIKIVIIQPHNPDREMNEILSIPNFVDKLHYIKGDILDKSILKKADIKNSKHVFLLSNQENISIKCDHFLSLACKSISQISEAKILVQYNFSQSLINDWTDFNISFSSNQIKNHIMVKNCFIHGFSTLIMNLTCSSSVFYIKDIVETPWMLEYISGASKEFYIVNTNSKDLQPKGDFIEFVKEIFIEFGLIVIGVKHKIYYRNRSGDELSDVYYYEYLINPINYNIDQNDSIIVIASDRLEAMKIFRDPNNQNFQKEKFAEVRNLDHLRYKFINIGEQIQDNEIPEILNSVKEFSISDCRENLSIFLQDHYLIFCTEDLLLEFIPVFNKNHKDILYFIHDCSGEQVKKNDDEIFQVKKKWERFSNVVKINANYNLEDDIEALNLNFSKHVFIQSFSKKGLNIPDSGIIPLVKLIEEKFPNCKYTLELLDEKSVKSLNNVFPQISKSDNSGNVNSKELFDIIPFQVWPKFAKSDIFFSSSIETLLPFSYHNKGLIELLQKFLSIEDEKQKGNKLFHNIEENSEFTVLKYIGNEGIVYGDIVRYFLENDEPMICLGIYRCVNTDLENDENMQNPLPYLSTNPYRNVMVNKNDELILLGKSKFFKITGKKKSTHQLLENKWTLQNLKEKENNIIKKDTLGIDSQIGFDKFDQGLNNLDDSDLIEVFKKNFFEFRESVKKLKSRKKSYFHSLSDDEDDMKSPILKINDGEYGRSHNLIEVEDIFLENKTDREDKEEDHLINSQLEIKPSRNKTRSKSGEFSDDCYFLEFTPNESARAKLHSQNFQVNNNKNFEKIMQFSNIKNNNENKCMRKRQKSRRLKESIFSQKIRKLFQKKGMNTKEAYNFLKNREKEIFLNTNYLSSSKSEK